MRQNRQRRACEGAAMAEAVIALPVLGALFLAVPTMHALHGAQQLALARARECGLAHALGGCRELPAACDAPPRAGAAPEPETETDVVARASGAAPGGAGVFDELPLIGDALAALLGDTIEAHASAAVPRRVRERPVEAAFTLVCNEQPRDVLSIARAMFCRRLPVIDCGGSDGP